MRSTTTTTTLLDLHACQKNLYLRALNQYRTIDRAAAALKISSRTLSRFIHDNNFIRDKQTGSYFSEDPLLKVCDIDSYRRSLLVSALDTFGSYEYAAGMMGVSVRTLFNWIWMYNIPPKRIAIVQNPSLKMAS